MAKALKVVGKIAKVAATVLAFIPGGQPFAAAASAIAAVATIGSQLLDRPEPAGGSPSKTLIDTAAASPYIMGRFRSGGVLVHDAAHGADYKKIPNPNRSLVYVYSDCGPVQEVEGLWSDGSFIVSQGLSSSSAYYGDSMGFSRQLGQVRETTALSGLNGSIPRWGFSYKLSGKAAGLVSLRWDKKQKKFQGGLPDLTSTIKGVKVYSARDDSTYPGGSGPCRLGDETTYIYSTNPSDHAVTYLYGRNVEGEKIFGVGLPRTGIDLPAFVEWANVCDANGWEVNGRIFEPADKWNNFKLILEAGSARPAHNAGKISISYDAPKVSVATFTIADLAEGDIELPATQGIRSRINTVVPRYMSPAHNWEYVPGSAVTSAAYLAADTETVRAEYQYSLVTDATQAAQLAGYDLVNARELTDLSMTFKPVIRSVGIGEAITLDMDEIGLQGQFELVSKKLNPLNMTVDVILRTLSSGRDPFALGATTTPPEVPTLQFGEDYDRIVTASTGLDAAIQAQIAQSWTRNLVLTASNNGSITISGHSRVYADETLVVTGTVLAGLSLNTRYSIYYDDADLEGGSVSYVATTDHASAQTSEEAPYRHYVGYAIVPADASAPANLGYASIPPNVVPEEVPLSQSALDAQALGGVNASDIIDDISDLFNTVGIFPDAQASAAAAEAAALLAEDDRLLAETARTSAQAAEAAAVSARDDAENFSASAATAEILTATYREAARLSAVKNRPTTMEEGGEYFTGNVISDPALAADATNSPALTAGSDADGFYIKNTSSSDQSVSLGQKGIIPYIVGATYRVTSTAKAVNAAGSFYLRGRMISSGFTNLSVIQDNKGIISTSLTEYSFEFTAPQSHYDAGARYFRVEALLNFVPHGSEHKIYSLDIQNISDLKAAENQALIAQNNAVITTIDAASTASDRTAVSNFRNEAEAFKDAAEASALITTSDRTIATEQAAIATAQAELSARINQNGRSALNANPDYQNWPEGDTYPFGWSLWSFNHQFTSYTTSDGRKVPWMHTPSANINDNGGIIVNQANSKDFVPGWYVVEVDVTLLAGGLRGAGVYVYSRNVAQGGAGSIHQVNFASDVTNEEIVAVPSIGKSYRYSKLVDMRGDGTDDAYTFHVMNNWAGHGAIRDPKIIAWNHAYLRPATSEEIRSGTVIPSLEASTLITQSAVASIEGDLSGAIALGVKAGTAARRSRRLGYLR